MFVTAILLGTGAWLLLAKGADDIQRRGIAIVHVTFGLFGVYLVAFHLVGYFACSAVHRPRMDAPRANMADTGWILIALLVGSTVSGLVLFLADGIAATTRTRWVQFHVFCAVTYAVASIVHYYYYLNHWKPALQTLRPRDEHSATS